jgi:hypothetical protein
VSDQEDSEAEAPSTKKTKADESSPAGEASEAAGSEDVDVVIKGKETEEVKQVTEGVKEVDLEDQDQPSADAPPLLQESTISPTPETPAKSPQEDESVQEEEERGLEGSPRKPKKAPNEGSKPPAVEALTSATSSPSVTPSPKKTKDIDGKSRKKVGSSMKPSKTGKTSSPSKARNDPAGVAGN